MATSIGAAAAQGLESGFNIGLRADEARRRKEQDDLQNQRLMRQDAAAEEDRAFNRSRIAQQDARLVQQDERQALLDQLKATDSELAEQRTQAEALASNYGGWAAIPQPVKEQFTQAQQAVQARRKQLFEKVYAPSAAEMKKRAGEQWARIGAGQMSLDDLSEKELAEDIAVLARRPLEDLMPGPDGSPSKIKQAAADIEAGFPDPQRGFAGNTDLLVRGFNVAFAPEISKGVGERARDGSVIEKKEVTRFVPAPEPYPPGSFVPIIRITVRRADGATTSYEDPLTEDRSDREDADIKVVTLEGALERLGQLETLAEAVQQPAMLNRVKKGLKDGADKTIPDFLQTVSMSGVKTPQQKIKVDRYTAGGKVWEQDRDEATGQPIGKPRDMGPAGTSKEVLQASGVIPQDGGGGRGAGGGAKGIGGAIGKKIAAIEELEADGDLTPDQAAAAKRKAVGITGKDEREAAAKDASTTAGIAQADRLIQSVDEALERVGWNTAGLGGAVMRRIPGTEARDLAGDLQTIKANLGFAELQAMRAASPTGGALGAIAVQELNALQSTVASLDESQSTDKLRASLQKIRGHYEKWRSALMQSRGDTEPPAAAESPPAAQAGRPTQNPVRPGIELPPATPPRQPAAAQQPTIAVNPKTGERLILKDGQWQPLK